VTFHLISQCCVVSDRICLESEIYISCYMFCENSGLHARVMDVMRGLVVPVSELNTPVQGQIKPFFFLLHCTTSLLQTTNTLNLISYADIS